MPHALATVGSKLGTVDFAFSSSPITRPCRAIAKGKVQSRVKTYNVHQNKFLASVSAYGPKLAGVKDWVGCVECRYVGIVLNKYDVGYVVREADVVARDRRPGQPPVKMPGASRLGRTTVRPVP